MAGIHFILVPFILAIRLQNEDQWVNGPEYTFDVNATTVANLTQDQGEHRGSHLNAKLKCQPKEPDVLQCHFENSSITKLSVKKFTPQAAVPKDAEHRKFGLGNATFDIKFNKTGIESYAFAEPPPPEIMNMYRLITNHLRLPQETKKPEDVQILEILPIGKCLLSYTISKEKLQNETSNAQFRLTWYPDDTMEQEVTRVKRVLKDAELCDPRAVYKFGTRHTYGVIPRESIESLRNSTEEVVVSSNNFVSNSTSTVTVQDLNGNKIGMVFDEIRLALVSIEPAKSAVKTISNAVQVPLNIDLTA